MKIERAWAMPDKNTFSIHEIEVFIRRNIAGLSLVIDPFANVNRIAHVTNDIDQSVGADYNLDAIEFLKMFGDSSVDGVLYDPPYSPRQVAEVYKAHGMTVNMETTQASFWGNLKDEIQRIVKPNGVVLSFGWNSNGIGMKRNFDIHEILIVAHGGHHNDTICVCERKRNLLF